MAVNRTVTLLPDAGPLITLAYADALGLLLKSGWSVALVDMVLHEVTRNKTPTSARIATWASDNKIPVLETRTYHRYRQVDAAAPARKANLGELAIQEAMTGFGLAAEQTGVFLFEDHKIARASFLLPENCRKVSTRAFLLFLEQQGLIESAADVERRAILAGRQFSQIRFPPE
ncbi:hypothetical protein [Paraburkholderia sp. BL10I2N1]|uniref:hypothetical protein n=1 Tax=Paraburkholderia sp. BL10I2N1 TaxID=1938796 RepID=UPI00105EA695|nr:hypothetical protein [Paraburkholderia sp. BL10I2N1]TDN58861.1 hypothetical protein B0G77_8027 [Paraburkholderia sp. BL10I2N1]